MAAAVSYELKSQARCLAAVEGDADRSRFVAATLNLRAPNELHVVEFSEDTNELAPVATYAVPHETVDMATCPSAAHASRILAVLNDGGTRHYASLTAVPALDDDEPSTPPPPAGRAAASAPQPALPEALRLQPSAGSAGSHGLMRRVLWNPSEDVGQAVSVQPGALCLWPLDRGDSAPSPSASCTASAAFGPRPTAAAANADAAGSHVSSDACIESACWDLHHAHTLALGSSAGDLATVDLRTMRAACALPGAHRGPLRALSYNPNRPYILLSAADDRALRVWDLRKAGAPGEAAGARGGASAACLLSLEGACQHWPTAAAFNRFHDQLALSAGTDGVVSLWRLAAISSAPPSAEPLDGDDADAELSAERDGLVRSLTEHDDSIYSLVWSAADAWLFASLSLDGRLCAHYVPAAEKYRILL